MPKTKTHTFGPGSMESLTLTTWVGKRSDNSRRFHARLEGTYTVYCGSGNEHDFQVKEKYQEWENDRGDLSKELRLVTDFTDFSTTGKEAASTVVATLLNWALEDWEDPCEVYEL